VALDAARVARGTRLLVAVSGGPDSTALLAALCDLRDAGRISLAACTVDHGIRAAAERRRDITFLRGLCSRLGVALHVARVPQGLLARRAAGERRSIEEVAREARRAELRRAAHAAGCRLVALGHTQDDSLETILMGVLRGSGAQGLRGISARQGMFVRPILGCTRAEVEAFLAARGLGSRTDSTNADRGLLRNRVRAELVPVLDASFPGWRTGLSALARKSALAAAAIEGLASAVPWTSTPRGWALPVRLFLSLPGAVREASLLRVYDLVAGEAGQARRMPRRLPSRFLRPAIEAQRFPAGGPVILQGHGVVLRAASGRLCLEADIVTSGKTRYLMEANRTGTFEVRSTGVTVEVAVAAAPARGRRPDAVILEREIDPPLVLRSKRKGDRLLLEQGTKPLAALLSEWKVPEGDRWKVPVLADRRGVLAVLGGPAGRGAVVRRGALARRGTSERRGAPARAGAAPREAIVAVRVRKRKGTSEQQS
jgi:tRNA(Ile)-lysidine synthase